LIAATFDHQVGKSLEFSEQQRNEKTAGSGDKRQQMMIFCCARRVKSLMLQPINVPS
jgi:hypothetical protein